MNYLESDRARLHELCSVQDIPKECADMLINLSVIIARSSTAKADNFTFILVSVLRDGDGSILQLLQCLHEIAADPGVSHQFLQDWQVIFPPADVFGQNS